MAKVKNKRNAGLADKVHKKKNSEAFKKKVNPFEVHVNKEKIKVLGKKSKHDRGLPGVSRAKAIQKRKDTLGTEMKLMNKTNTFLDRRIGEKNSQLSAEDRMIARFAAERVRQHNKKSIYNLADDEILTHRGQTLEDIEKFDDPRSSDDEEEDGKRLGGLDDDFVSEGHFGGGILSKSDSKDGAKSHKDLIEQLIAESKKRKAEKQKEKQQTLDLTEKLDSEWKDLQPVVFKRPRIEEKEKEVEKESAIDKVMKKAEKNSEDYDKMMRELIFEKRGTPSDGLKTDEKREKEEREKLEKLEMEREQRMYGDEEVTAKTHTTVKHRSADDLDDNFLLEDEQNFMLAYDKDGKPLVPEKVLKDFSVPNAKPKFNDGISDSSSDDDGDDDEEDADSDEDDDNHQNENEDSEEDESEVEEKGDENNDGVDTEIQERLDELNRVRENEKNISSKTQSEKKIVEKNIYKKESNGILINEDESSEEEEDTNDSDSDIEDKTANKNVNNFDDLKGSDKESEEEDSEEDSDKITSFFDMKLAAGDNLKELLAGKTPAQQSTALQKLIKSYDPSLSENNKELLTTLFAHMLQYVNDIFINLTEETDVLKAFLIFDKIAPYFYDLAHTNKVSSKKFIVQLLKEKHDKFMKKPKKMPDLDTLIFFKLISLVYPTSDSSHPVTTPALTFMAEILTTSRFDTAYAISRGFFVASLVLEYIALSKRLVPSAINFLRGILYLTANTTVLNPIQIVPPFRLHRDVKILNLEHDCSKMAVENKMAARDLTASDINDDFKVRCLYVCIVMLKEYFDYFSDLEAQQYLFEPHISLVSRIDLDLYPKKVATRVRETVKYMKECLEVKTFTSLAAEKTRVKALRMYEPDIQEVFTGSKSSKLSREKAESARLKSKYKKEMKGALREIRRDKAYIASVKIRQKIQSDNMRKEKVKQIFKDASIQQGELNKLKRGK